MPNSPLSRFLKIFAVLLVAVPVWSQQNPPQYREHELARFITVEELESDELSATVRINFAPDDATRLPARFTHPFWLVGAAEEELQIEVLEHQWAYLSSTGEEFGPFELNHDTGSAVTGSPLATVQRRLQDELRLVGLYRVELPLLQTQNAAVEERSQQFRVYTRSLTFRCVLPETNPAPLPAPLAEYDPYLAALTPLLVANPSMTENAARLPSAAANAEAIAAWNERLTAASNSGFLLKSELTREGVYVLTPETLRAAGVQLDNLDADRIRVYLGNRELRAMETGVERNRFLGRARLYFYVPKRAEDRQPFVPLWVMAVPGDEPASRIATAGLATRDQLSIGTAEAFLKETIFRPAIFNHKQDSNAPQLRWATASVGVGTFETFEFTVDNPAAGRTGVVEVWAARSDRLARGRYEVVVNGNSIGIREVEGARVERQAIEFDGALLRTGTNTLAIRNPPNQPGENYADITFVQAEVSSPVSTEGLGPNRLVHLELEAPGALSLTVRKLDGMGSQTFLVDVTDPLEPTFHTLAGSGGRDGQFYSGTVEARTSRPRFVHTSPETAWQVPNLRRVQAPSFAERIAPLDYLVITHSSLRNAIMPLANRRAETRHVEVVNVEELYDAFSYGEVRFEAIRDAIRHAFLNREGARMSEVLLVGEASEFWWDEKSSGPTFARNMVPIFGWRDPAARIRGDEGYSLLFGGGPLPDVEIARISADNTRDVDVVVKKILGYEDAPPSGDWRNRHFFILDDEPEFLRVAQDIVRKTFSGPNVPRIFNLQDYVYENYFRGFWRKRSVEMTDQVVQAISDGAQTITYLGHGGPNLWSEERIFHIRDIDSTISDGRLPVLLAGSCDTGWVDYPTPPVNTSLSEHFLRRENGGAVAAYIPVGATSSYEHNFILSAFYDALLNKGVADLGKLVLMSKVNYYLHRNNVSVTEQFILMGDPAMTMVPQEKMDGVVVSPAHLLSHNGGMLRIEAAMPGIEWGMATATLVDSERLPLASQRFRVREGKLNAEFRIPRHLTPGEHGVVLTVANEQLGTQASAYVAIPVSETRVRIERIAEPARQEIATAGQPMAVAMTIHNDSAAELSGVDLQIVEGTTGMVIGRSPLRVPAGGSISPRFERRLPLQVTSIRARVAPAGSDSNAAALAESVVIIPQNSEFNRFISFPASAIEVRRDEDEFVFLMPLFNLTSRPLENLSAVLRWQDNNDGSRNAVGTRQTIPSIAPAEKQVVEFRAAGDIPSGNQTFSFEVYGPGDAGARPLQIEVFNAEVRRGPNLEIVRGSMRTENDHPRAGNTVFVRFVARNSGHEPVENITARLYLDTPWDEEKVAKNVTPWASTNTIPRLMPGEEHEFRLRWDPERNDGHRVRLFATVMMSNARITEDDMADNVASLTVDLRSAPNLAVRPAEITRDRDYALAGENVRVTIPIHNTTEEDFLRDFRVSVYAVRNDGSSERRFSERFTEMLGGESATIQFDWQVKPGEHQLRIDVNEDREYLETTHADNVATLSFPYVIDENYFDDSRRFWDFTGFPNYGSHHGVVYLPTGHITVAPLPRAQSTGYGFERRFLVSGELGNDLVADGLWGLRGNEILLAHEETSDVPLRYRIPMPKDDETTYYDVYLGHVGNLRPEVMSGQFRYRLEDQRDWALFNRAERGTVFMERVQTRDNFLDLELAAPPFPAFNHIWSISVSPVMGIYESPIVRFQKAPAGGIVADVDTTEGGKVRFDVRFGTLGSNIAWQPWEPVALGTAIPAAPEGTDAFQWRARVYQDQGGAPLLGSVGIEVVPGAAPRTEANIAAGN